MSALNQSRPLRSIFAHRSGVRRMARCTWTSSGGFGGRPLGRFSCSMRRSVAPIYWDANIPCISYFLGYIKSMNTRIDPKEAEALKRLQEALESVRAAERACAAAEFSHMNVLDPLALVRRDLNLVIAVVEGA